VLRYLRQRALTQGFLGNSKFWYRLGVIVWSVHLLNRLMSRRQTLVYEAELEPGQTLVISDLSPLEAKGPGKSVKLDT
jgi:type II secretory pathway component PulK